MNRHLRNIASLKNRCSSVVLASLFALCCANVAAAPVGLNLVKNGDFSQTAGVGQIGFNTTVADWSTGGYNFLFAQGTADTTGAMSWFKGPLMLWGANNGGANALASSSDGGNFIANDGAYGTSEFRQLIDGLIVGQTYELNFEWAAAQQYGFTGATTEHWRVNLGSDASTWQATSIYSNASHASSSWMNASMIFTASNVSQWLSFMAAGTPEGEPPFSLLDGVSLTALPSNEAAVPEPASLALLFAGLGLIALLLRRSASTTS